MKTSNNLADILTVQVARIEKLISKRGYNPIIKNFAAIHSEEIVYFQYYFKETPNELDEKEVDLSLLREWLVEFHPQLVSDYTHNGTTSFFHIIELVMNYEDDMKNDFLTYCLINL